MRFLLPFAFFLLAACSKQAQFPYPVSFPAEETMQGCPKIDGTYSNLGVQHDGKGVFLSNIIGPFNAAFTKPEERALAYRRVSLMNAVFVDVVSHDEGGVDITMKAVDRDLILHPIPGKGQELVCQKGWLTLVKKKASGSLGLEREKIGFNHTARGGLLVKRQRENVFADSLGTGGEKALGWYYFPPER